MWICLVCGNENDDQLSRCICGLSRCICIPLVEQSAAASEDKKAEIIEEPTCNKWFYNQNGNQIGPVSVSTLKNKYRSGEISDETFVWTIENDEWRPLGHYDIDANMRDLFSNPKPEPTIQTTQEIGEHTTTETAGPISSEAIKEKKEYSGSEQTSQNEGRAINFYYQILGVPQNASKDEIKQAYKDLLDVWNPDGFSNEPSLQRKAQQKIKEIDEAYEKLLLYVISIDRKQNGAHGSKRSQTSARTSMTRNREDDPYQKNTALAIEKNGKKRSFCRWLLWWQIDRDELTKQVSEYQTLSIGQAARGISLIFLIFSALVTTAFIIFSNVNSALFIDVFICLILGSFIYRGHQWAMLGAMIYWSLLKFSLIYYGVQSYSVGHMPNPLIHLLWWSIYMHAFYLAFKVERLRRHGHLAS